MGAFRKLEGVSRARYNSYVLNPEWRHRYDLLSAILLANTTSPREWITRTLLQYVHTAAGLHSPYRSDSGAMGYRCTLSGAQASKEAMSVGSASADMIAIGDGPFSWMMVVSDLVAEAVGGTCVSTANGYGSPAGNQQFRFTTNAKTTTGTDYVVNSGSMMFYTYDPFATGGATRHVSCDGEMTGGTQVVVGTRNSTGTMKIYIDGVEKGSRTPLSNNANLGYNSQQKSIGFAYCNDAGEDWAGTCYPAKSTNLTFACAARVWGADEVAAMSARHWDIYEPVGARSYFFAAGGGISGTGANTEAADTSTAQGEVLITGTGASTEAADTSTAAGAVHITGTGANTEAADTSAGTGTVTGDIIGTAANTEAADSSSGSGIVTIAGTLAQTEEEDTSEGTGVVTIAGSATNTEANDTSSTPSVRAFTHAILSNILEPKLAATLDAHRSYNEN